METKRIFCNGNRYQFDFNLCSIANGYAQLDTTQDASYFGTWINPFIFRIINFCEGDVTIFNMKDSKELKKELENLEKWNYYNGHSFKGIDPGFNEKLLKRFIELDLTEYLHSEYRDKIRRETSNG